MENQVDLDASSSTVDEMNPNAQPVASSTPENEQSSKLRRSLREKRVRTPCECCTTGMHVRCYTSITGRRPIHSPREPNSCKKQGVTRNTSILGSSANESLSISTSSRGRNSYSKQNSSTLSEKKLRETKALADRLIKKFDPIKRRRSLVGFTIAATKRKVEECGEISFTSSAADLKESPSPPKRVRVDNLQSEPSSPQLATSETLNIEVESVLRSENILNGTENSVALIENIPSPALPSQLETNTSIVNGVSPQIGDLGIEESKTDDKRISYLSRDFEKEENMTKAIEISTSIGDLLIKDKTSDVIKRENNLREAKENSILREGLVIEENIIEANGVSTQTGDSLMKQNMLVDNGMLNYMVDCRSDEETNEISTPIGASTLTGDLSLKEHMSVGNGILSSEVDLRHEENIVIGNEISPMDGLSIEENFIEAIRVPITHKVNMTESEQFPVAIVDIKIGKGGKEHKEKVLGPRREQMDDVLSNEDSMQAKKDISMEENTLKPTEFHRQTCNLEESGEDRVIKSERGNEHFTLRETVEVTDQAVDTEMENEETENDLIDTRSTKESEPHKAAPVASKRRCIII